MLESRSAAIIFTEQCPSITDIWHKVISKAWNERKVSGRGRIRRLNIVFGLLYTECSTTYQTRQFFNNSNTNDNIATKFEQEYVRCVRNEEECVCSAPNCWDMEQRSAS
jgi:hypothetical protein